MAKKNTMRPTAYYCSICNGSGKLITKINKIIVEKDCTKCSTSGLQTRVDRPHNKKREPHK